MKEIIEKFLQEEHDSRVMINSLDLKNRYLHPYFPTIILDNFYESPDLVRAWALQQEFFKGELELGLDYAQSYCIIPI